MVRQLDSPQSMGPLLDIGEIAQRSGMAASALRYYEHAGIIDSEARLGLGRQYRPEVLQTLAVVAICQEAGFTLAEIRALLSTQGRRGWKALVEHKRDELRARAARLASVAEQLDHAIGCPSPNVLDCEHFQSVLQRALPVAKRSTTPMDRPGARS
ncbi:MAG TPA: MerR family transcriptional regulator [Acidimicrobiales bacterium]|nr:MerR family transcriptional regulator [Acidimicrobiales bacterium]